MAPYPFHIDPNLRFHESLLHSSDILDILRHHVHFAVVVELFYSVPDLVQISRDSLSLLRQLLLEGDSRRLANRRIFLEDRLDLRRNEAGGMTTVACQISVFPPYQDWLDMRNKAR